MGMILLFLDEDDRRLFHSGHTTAQLFDAADRRRACFFGGVANCSALFMDSFVLTAEPLTGKHSEQTYWQPITALRCNTGSARNTG